MATRSSSTASGQLEIQSEMFGPAPLRLPEGMVYQPDFLSREEESSLIDLVRGLPLKEAQYKSYTARRRVLSYGGSFDYDANKLQPTQELDPALYPLRAKLARWLGIAPQELVHALIAEYREGTPLGWHRDVPNFEDIVGVSLLGDAVMRFRPYPPEHATRADTLKLPVAPRSVYLMRGPSRWAWQHSVSPTKGLRYSITFRTARR